MVVGLMFGGVGCHATSKGAELSYKIDYLIKVALFRPIHPTCPICPVCSVCLDIIHIFWISTFRGNFPHSMDISIFCGYYLHMVDIVDISAFCGYCLYWSHYELLSL